MQKQKIWSCKQTIFPLLKSENDFPATGIDEPEQNKKEQQVSPAALIRVHLLVVL
ncbi:MAG TPA: hypothetical protein GXX42_11265 [Petrimonas sp.]|nr:hypothetical protein [Petrimonas sp.]